MRNRFHVGGLAVVVLGFTVTVAHSALLHTGMNLASAEFGATPTPGNWGTYGSSYIYPNQSEVNYFMGKGLNTFRLPFRWERLQHSLNGALDAAELTRMDAFVNATTGKGATVIIEPHNFARYYPPAANFQQDPATAIGMPAVPTAAFGDFWSKLAGHYKNNPRVIFNLMNEPAAISTDQWAGSANGSIPGAVNTAIAAIRATGATNEIQAPGTRYTGAWTWNNSDNFGRSNAAAMLNTVDPLNNTVFEVHQYFDNDGSGTSATISGNNVNIGMSRLTVMTNWLRTNHKKGFLGEFAFANSTIGTGASQIGDEALTNLLNFLDANSDVWTGWAWWGGGPWWGNYMFAADPANGVDRPNMQYLSAHASGLAIAGDYNADGYVDAADYTVWADHFGQITVLGDGNYDGVVNAADYTVWSDHFGQGTPHPGAIPEPAGALEGVGMVAALALRRGRRGKARRTAGRISPGGGG